MYSIKLIQSLQCESLSIKYLQVKLSKQLIHDLDGSIALNKGFVSALRERWLLNSSKHIKVHTFLLKINCLLHQFTLMEFTEVINNGDSLAYKTRMDLN